MDFRGVKPSTRFEDRTARSPAERALDFTQVALNPVIAYRNVRGKLIENGVIDPGPVKIKLGLPKRGAQ